MTTRYEISASYSTAGTDGAVWCSTAEVLGDAYGATYATREEAQRIAEDMQADVAQYGLDPSTVYSVHAE